MTPPERGRPLHGGDWTLQEYFPSIIETRQKSLKTRYCIISKLPRIPEFFKIKTFLRSTFMTLSSTLEADLPITLNALVFRTCKREGGSLNPVLET